MTKLVLWSSNLNRTMKQIIVPTDFSKGAWSALLYAAKLAEAMEIREILVLNSYYAPHSGAATLVSIDRIMQKDSEDGLNALMIKVRESGLSAKFNFRGKSIHASLLDAINSEITDYTENMVVMGSMGESGTIEKIFGSNASEVASRAQCPVVIVPPNAGFAPKKNVVLASDYDEISDQNMKVLQVIKNTHPSAKLEVVHVVKDTESITGPVAKEISQEDLPHEVVEITGNEVSVALQDYMSSSQADLLIMIKQDSGFLGNLFHTSITKKIALLASIPLLVLK